MRESVTLNPRQYDTFGLPTRFFNPGELEALLHLYESARVIVEFGVHEGRNAVAALRNIEGLERYVGVDVLPDYAPHLGYQRREIPKLPGRLALGDERFDLIVKPRGTFDLTAEDLPRCDVVFIDGDHSRKGVENDTALARQIVRPGGVIVWHDDNGSPRVEVTQTLDDYAAAGAPILRVAGTWLAFERV